MAFLIFVKYSKAKEDDYRSVYNIVSKTFDNSLNPGEKRSIGHRT